MRIKKLISTLYIMNAVACVRRGNAHLEIDGIDIQRGALRKSVMGNGTLDCKKIHDQQGKDRCDIHNEKLPHLI